MEVKLALICSPRNWSKIKVHNMRFGVRWKFGHLDGEI